VSDPDSCTALLYASSTLSKAVPLVYKLNGYIIPSDLYLNLDRIVNKKLSCRRETARRFVPLNILLSHSRSFEMTLLSRACLSPY